MLTPTWETNGLAAEVRLTEAQVEKHEKVMKQVTLIELESYLDVIGSCRLKRGPASFLQSFLGEGEDISHLFTYLEQARKSCTWIEGMIFDPPEKTRMRNTLDGCVKGILT